MQVRDLLPRVIVVLVMIMSILVVFARVLVPIILVVLVMINTMLVVFARVLVVTLSV